MKRAVYLENHPELDEHRIEVSPWTGPHAENDIDIEFFSANESEYSIDMSKSEAISLADIIFKAVNDIDNNYPEAFKKVSGATLEEKLSGLILAHERQAETIRQLTVQLAQAETRKLTVVT